MRDRLNCRLLKNKAGWSPEDISHTVESPAYDLIFIDGDHSHPQVTRDLYGVMDLVGPDSVLCWHDYWLHGVPESVVAARQAGVQCLKVDTSCEMVFGTRSPSVFQRLAKLFPDARAPIKQRHPLAYLKLYQALADGAVKKYILGRTTDASRIKAHAPIP